MDCPLFGRRFMRGAITPTDIIETTDAYVVEMDTPGMNKADLDVKVKNANYFCVSGTRMAPDSGLKGSYLTQERIFGSFERCFELPKKINADRVTAAVKDHVLTLTLPKIDASSSEQSTSVPIK